MCGRACRPSTHRIRAIVVAVDPGHGGRFPGAVRDGFAEKDFNLDISLKLRDLLEALLNGPDSPVTRGSALSYGIRVTNHGNAASAGWTLELHSVASVPVYDGSGQLGTLMGSLEVPDGLQPGSSVDLTVTASAPATAGEWLVKSDVRLPDDSYASSPGVVPMQLPLTTVAP